MKSALPSLRFGDSLWEGHDILPSWSGFQTRLGPYGSLSGPEPSDGRTFFSLAPPGDAEDGRPPAPEQVAAYAHLMANEAKIARMVHQTILDYALEIAEDYEIDVELDLIAMRGLVGLNTVHILPVAKNGLAYVGFEMGCNWDDEHGCGVLTHCGRIVSYGQADESFEEWIAEDDGGEMLT